MMNYNAFGNNPYLNPQAQLQNLVQQYPQYFNQTTQQAIAPQNQGLRTLPVTNREEAVGTPVDVLNGTPTLFYNKAKEEIYLKQVTDINTGTAIVKDYVLKESVSKPIKEDKKETIINTHEKDFEALNDKIDGLEQTINDLKTGLKHSIDKLVDMRSNKNAK